VTEPSHAVFLSYASQDAVAALRICESLRTAGIEVWLDRSELRGGDAWDSATRKQITNSDAVTNISSGQLIKATIPLRPRVLMAEFGYRF
jgi:TIR domain